MNKLHYQLVEQYGAAPIIEALVPFITERRKQRIDTVLDNRLNNIQLAIESPADINNALAAVRTCEALGISKIHIITPENDAGSMHTITQGAFYWTDIIFYKTLDTFLQYISHQDLLLAGAVIDGSVTLADVPVTKSLCLLIGNEQHGLSEKAKTSCQLLYRIPMVGMSESLNLSVSAAISLYDTTQRKRATLKTKGDLSTEQSQQLRARYYINSVNGRLVDGLIK